RFARKLRLTGDIPFLARSVPGTERNLRAVVPIPEWRAAPCDPAEHRHSVRRIPRPRVARGTASAVHARSKAARNLSKLPRLPDRAGIPYTPCAPPRPTVGW